MNETIKLTNLIKVVATLSRYSLDIYWVGDCDFKSCVFVNDAYESIIRYPKAAVLKDLSVLYNYMKYTSREHFNAFLEMGKKIKKEGNLSVFDATYQIVRGGDGYIRTINDHGQPVYDSDGKHIGYMGVARDISFELIRKQLPIKTLMEFPFADKKKYFLKEKYKNVCLSARQAECAFYLIQGKTAKQTAAILKLSPRTVEHIHQAIKNKLGLIYRSDIFEALIEGDFIEVLMAG